MDVTTELKKNIATIASQYHLELVLLFGSRARGDVHNNSDVDIAFLSTEEYDMEKKLTLIAMFEQLFGKSVDLVDLRNASVLLGDRIVRDAVILFGDDKTFSRVRSRAHIRYMDFQPFFRRQKERLYRHFGVKNVYD